MRIRLLLVATLLILGCGTKPAAKSNVVDAPLPIVTDDNPASPETVLKGGNSGFWSLAFSPDGKTLAGGQYKQIVLWDVSSGAQSIISGHKDSVTELKFSPDGALLASAGSSERDNTIKVWDVNKRSEIATFTFSQNSRGTMAFASDGKTLTYTSLDAGAKRWDVAARRAGNSPLPNDGDTYFSFSSSGDVVATAKRGEVRVLEVASGRQVAHFAGLDGNVAGVSETAQIVVAENPKLTLWDFSGKKKATLGDRVGDRNVSITPDGKIMAISMLSAEPGGIIRIWELPTGKEIASCRGPNQFNSVALSADGKRVAAGEDHGGIVRVWELAEVISRKK